MKFIIFYGKSVLLKFRIIFLDCCLLVILSCILQFTLRCCNSGIYVTSLDDAYLQVEASKESDPWEDKEIKTSTFTIKKKIIKKKSVHQNFTSISNMGM